MRTLVVSDLHLGARDSRDLLRRRAPRAALLEAVAQTERLVMLGDLLELRQSPQRDALDAAGLVLREVGAALAPGARVVLVPGNHDHMLLAPWLQRRADRASPGSAPPPLGLQSAVDWGAAEPLARLAGWLAPAELEVSYPGYWLREDVYATHGHYADRHCTLPMLERIGAGVMARIVGETEAGPRSAEDYETTLGPMYAWIDALAQGSATHTARVGRSGSAVAWRALTSSGPRRRRRGGLRRRALAASFPVLVAALNRAGIGPLSADLSTAELRRARLSACREMLLRLGVDASHVICGHTHRAGPLPADDRSEWRAIAGGQLINVGCWVDETHFLGPDPAHSPYRAGFCATLEDAGPPVLRNLLDPA